MGVMGLTEQEEALVKALVEWKELTSEEIAFEVSMPVEHVQGLLASLIAKEVVETTRDALGAVVYGFQSNTHAQVVKMWHSPIRRPEVE